MQHLKEFLTSIQTFDLRIIEDEIQTEWGTNEKKHIKSSTVLNIIALQTIEANCVY